MHRFINILVVLILVLVSNTTHAKGFLESLNEQISTYVQSESSIVPSSIADFQGQGRVESPFIFSDIQNDVSQSKKSFKKASILNTIFAFHVLDSIRNSKRKFSNYRHRPANIPVLFRKLVI